MSVGLAGPIGLPSRLISDIPGPTGPPGDILDLEKLVGHTGPPPERRNSIRPDHEGYISRCLASEDFVVKPATKNNIELHSWSWGVSQNKINGDDDCDGFEFTIRVPMLHDQVRSQTIATIDLVCLDSSGVVCDTVHLICRESPSLPSRGKLYEFRAITGKQKAWLCSNFRVVTLSETGDDEDCDGTVDTMEVTVCKFIRVELL